jgi:hypothetical protein
VAQGRRGEKERIERRALNGEKGVLGAKKRGRKQEAGGWQRCAWIRSGLESIAKSSPML